MLIFWAILCVCFYPHKFMHFLHILHNMLKGFVLTDRTHVGFHTRHRFDTGSDRPRIHLYRPYT